MSKRFLAISVVGLLLTTDSFPITPSRASEQSTKPAGVNGGLIALSLRDQNGKLQIFTIAPDGTNRTQLTFEGENGRADWSPDGRRIAYMSQSNGGSRVGVMDADGSHQQCWSRAPRRIGHRTAGRSPSRALITAMD